MPYRVPTDIPECLSISQIQQASAQDDHLQHLKSFIITGWPNMKDKLHSDLRPYGSYRNDLAVIDGVVMKGTQIVIPTVLKQQVLDQLHTNHMGIKKIKITHMQICLLVQHQYRYQKLYKKLHNMS